jgi:hypothetical protein
MAVMRTTSTIAKLWTSHGIVLTIFVLLGSLVAAQETGSKYVTGTILQVKDHDFGTKQNDAIAYDVTLRIGDQDLVILYTPVAGSRRVTFAQGEQVLIKVGAKSVGFRDMLGRYSEHPILDIKAVPQHSE